MPSINILHFDGLPLDSLLEACALAVLVPFAVSASLREALATTLQRFAPWARNALLAVGLAAIVIKLLLLAIGADRGFVACYSSPWRPPPQRCETSYANWLRTHDGATRVEPHINYGPYGPSDARINELETTNVSEVYATGLAASNWNLSFANDLRFNDSKPAELARHERLPMEVEWRGTAAIPSDGLVRVRYVGSGGLRVGPTRLKLARSEGVRTIVARAPPGNQPFEAQFQFVDRDPRTARAAGSPYGELRVLDARGRPIAATSRPMLERLAAGIVDLALVFAFLALLAVLVLALGRSAWSLSALVVVGGLAAFVFSSPYEAHAFPSSHQDYAFMALAALVVLVLVWRPPRRPVLWAYAAFLILNAIRLFGDVPDLQSVLYFSSGTDWLSYASFARDVILGRSLEGGEAVFFGQPGSRYVLGLQHLILGDGDGLVILWSSLGLSLSFAALISWHRARWQSPKGLKLVALAGMLLLGLLNSSTILSLVTLSASEVLVWTLLPLAIAAPQLRPQGNAPWIGSAAAAALSTVIRSIQVLSAITILAASVAALGRGRRNLLVAGGAVVAAIALLPAIHNLEYGNRFVFSTTTLSVNQEIKPSELRHIFTDHTVVDRLKAEVRYILYVPPDPATLPKRRADQTPRAPAPTHGHIRLLLWGLLALWLAVLGQALLRVPLLRRLDDALPGDRKGAGLSAAGWLLLLLPIVCMAPYLILLADNIYPRHIIIGYLAMGLVAIGAFREMADSSESAPPAED